MLHILLGYEDGRQTENQRTAVNVEGVKFLSYQCEKREIIARSKISDPQKPLHVTYTRKPAHICDTFTANVHFVNTSFAGFTAAFL